MNDKQKSARNAKYVQIFLGVFLLAGCADTRLPSWLTGEPGQEVLTAPRVVSRPEGAAQKTWPNLAEVPEKKPVFTSAKERDKTAEELQSDRLKAQAEMERLRNIDLYDIKSDDNSMPQEDFSFSALRPKEDQP
ncbi:MAG: hypothetical protein AB7E52_02220 [Bdellovibrionales bacterium]